MITIDSDKFLPQDHLLDSNTLPPVKLKMSYRDAIKTLDRQN